MSEQDTPETDAALTQIYREDVTGCSEAIHYVPLEISAQLERERDEARELARELLDALENCREDSVELLGEWAWKRGTIARNDAAVEELEGRISVADSVIDKAKEVLP